MPVSAAVLELANGDKISGEIVSETEESITFRSPILGELTVPKNKVKIESTISRTESLSESLAGLPPSPEPSPTEKSDPKPELAAQSAATKPSDETPPWKGRVEFGFRQQKGRTDSTNFDLRASANRKLEFDSFEASARLLYGVQGEKTISDRYDASFQWRRELNDRTFAQTLTSFTRDDLKSINQNWEQNVGAGYRVLKTEDHTLNMGGGLTGQYRDSLNTNAGFSTLVELFQDYQYKISGRITLLQNAVAQYTPDSQTRFITVANQPTAIAGATNYKLRFNTTLQGKLSKQFSMNLRYEYEFDNAVANANARSDQRITSSVGYAF